MRQTRVVICEYDMDELTNEIIRNIKNSRSVELDIQIPTRKFAEILKRNIENTIGESGIPADEFNLDLDVYCN